MERNLYRIVRSKTTGEYWFNTIRMDEAVPEDQETVGWAANIRAASSLIRTLEKRTAPTVRITSPD